jgi:CelD/BcsL family acetyltransferase involved in cellulose biosynthesis
MEIDVEGIVFLFNRTAEIGCAGLELAVPRRAAVLEKRPSTLDCGRFSVTLCSDFNTIRRLWKPFASGVGDDVFADLRWLENWLRACQSCGRQTSPLFVFGTSEGRPAFVMPFAINRDFGLRWLGWLGQHVSDYNSPLLADGAALSGDDIRSLLNAVHQVSGGFDFVFLDKQREWLNGARNPFASLNWRASTKTSHQASIATGWDEYCHSRRKSRSLKRQREKERSLEKRFGSAEFRTAATTGERLDIVRQLITWKTRQLDRKRERNPFRHAAFRSFLERIATDRSMIESHPVHVLEVAGRPAAISIGIRNGRSHFLYQCSYNEEEFGRYSVGTTLLVSTMRESLAAGRRIFDFGNGNEAYKSHWATQSSQLFYTTEAFSLAGRVAVAAIHLAHHAIRWRRCRTRLRSGGDTSEVPAQ